MDLSPAELLDLLEKTAARRKLYTFRPFGHPDTLCPDGEMWKEMHATKGWCEWSNKPWQWDFLAAENGNPERAALCANGVGKTWLGGYGTAMHLTGEYPSWWPGRRFNHPVLAWVGSITNETQREYTQAALLGNDLGESLGTGLIPYEKIIGKVKTRQAGIADVADVCYVRHKAGGVSKVIFKTYEQGWRKWQGGAPHIVWLDEEPDDMRIYTECQTRVLRTNGMVYATLTPLLGQTDLILHFQSPKAKGVWWIGATWEDVPHLDQGEKQRLKDSYPDHEVQARTAGVPMMGEGRVFTTPEDEIRVSPFELPPWFSRIKGIDFGIDHPAAVSDLAWDRDKDILYVTRTWKKKGAEAEDHIDAINETDPWVPVAWPHDGTNREKSSGIRLKDFYVNKQVRMLGQSARYKNDKGGSQAVEPIILEVQGRIRNGGFKVFSTCRDFFEEYRNYHRKDGRLVARMDDVLKATFYAVMMRRYATTSGFMRQNKAPAVPIFSMRH